ncbi:hypothetical protein F9L69_00610 [Brucella melitensis]|nr:hypothetical protein CJP68_02950 [Brucella melitensis]MUJ53534.1 hypothetical protein [Brucella abortus]ASZ29677.1 hypothetical protein CK633_05885 [Brucella melitensis]ATV13073.1 hypothetical protein CT124_04295 [Brucella melitensis]AUS53891.1 hypothetical protein CX678_04280 [Brucella melitensis]
MFDILNSIGVIGRRLFLSVFFLLFSALLSACVTYHTACVTYHTDRQIDDTLGPPGPIAKVPG